MKIPLLETQECTNVGPCWTTVGHAWTSAGQTLNQKSHTYAKNLSKSENLEKLIICSARSDILQGQGLFRRIQVNIK